MSAGEFLDSTPVEVSWKIDAYNDRQDERRHEIYILGRLSSLALSEDFPEFDDIFSPESGPMSDEELLAECQAKGLKMPDL
jgi:hypothetical protein